MANNEKKSLPLVSIIIDNYNYGRFIQDAIESALNQAYPNIEVIVVDDGSTDNSREIISRYASAGVVKAVLKENGGQASAMNAGFEISRGDLVMFLDSDDVLKPQAIEAAVKAWHPGVSKIQWRLEGVDAELKPTGMFYPPAGRRMPSGNLRTLVNRWLEYTAPPQSGNAYSRVFLDQAMPIPEMDFLMGADGPLVLASPFFGLIVSVDEVLGYYRRHKPYNMNRALSDVRFRLTTISAVKRYLENVVPGLKLPTYSGVSEERYIMIYCAIERCGGFTYFKKLSLGLHGAMDSLAFPFFKTGRKRILSVLWFITIGVLPRKLAKPLAIKGLPDI